MNMELHNQKMNQENPTDYSLYYTKGGMLRHLAQPQESIIGYSTYLRHCHEHDRNIPNAHFMIAENYIYMQDFDNAKRFYEAGCASEKLRLSIFQDRPTTRDRVQHLLGLLSRTKKSVGDKASNSNRNSINSPTSKYKDPRRTTIVHLFRENFASFVDLNVPTSIKETHVPESIKKPPMHQQKPVQKLKPVLIEDISCKEKIHSGHILHCTIIDHFIVISGAYTLVEDKKGTVERLGLYNFGFKTPAQAEEVFWIGKSISIKNPYMRVGASDLKPYIRVDCENDIISNTPHKKEVCAFCITENANMMYCKKCKTPYCSRDCQMADWKEFQHKLICKALEQSQKP